MTHRRIRRKRDTQAYKTQKRHTEVLKYSGKAAGSGPAAFLLTGRDRKCSFAYAYDDNIGHLLHWPERKAVPLISGKMIRVLSCGYPQEKYFPWVKMTCRRQGRPANLWGNTPEKKRNSPGEESKAGVRGRPSNHWGNTPEKKRNSPGGESKAGVRGGPSNHWGDTPEKKRNSPGEESKAGVKGRPSNHWGNTPEKR